MYNPVPHIVKEAELISLYTVEQKCVRCDYKQDLLSFKICHLDNHSVCVCVRTHYTYAETRGEYLVSSVVLWLIFLRQSLTELKLVFLASSVTQEAPRTHFFYLSREAFMWLLET